jgi:pimeloyl-ACP methyl ester carboxylesterase
MNVQPYSISISPFVIEDLRERLGRARWPDEISNSGWEYGTNMAFLKDLCTHWGHGFDWKEQEDHLNTFANFQTRIDEINLHFIHEKGKGTDAIPLLLIHGYPDSFVRFLKLIPLLTAEGPDGLSFDVIVPSIPGFGFSDRPSQLGMDPQRVAGMFARLMTELGYEKFISHGGDWGSVISEGLFTLKSEEMTSKEKEYLHAGQRWQAKEGAYALLQGTKPQTLAYAINDSPIGLAAWIIEKFYSWSDCDGDLEKVYARDELLTNLTIYWVTQTTGSSFRIYYEQAHHRRQGDEKIKVPAAFCISAKDLVPAPREFAERFFNVQQWTQLPTGGHFAAMEQPGRLAEDLFRFAGKVVARPVMSAR